MCLYFSVLHDLNSIHSIFQPTGNIAAVLSSKQAALLSPTSVTLHPFTHSRSHIHHMQQEAMEVEDDGDTGNHSSVTSTF